MSRLSGSTITPNQGAFSTHNDNDALYKPCRFTGPRVSGRHVHARNPSGQVQRHRVVVDIPKGKWGVITGEDLEKARPKIKPGDIVIVHTGWYKKYSDSVEYFYYSPGLYKEAGEWFVDKEVKAVGVDQQALDHPLRTTIAPHGPGPLRPDICAEYKRETGHEVLEDFPYWEPCHNLLHRKDIMGYENGGGDLDQAVGKRVTIAGFPIRWEKGDGSIVRLVAIGDEGNQ
jgi:kynurenine formamidase